MLGASRASFNLPGITLFERDIFTIFVMTGRMTSKQSLRIVVGMGSNRQVSSGTHGVPLRTEMTNHERL